MWEVEYTDQFETWWNSLTQKQQEQIDAAVEVLEHHGPSLGRPLVDRIEHSQLDHLKEVRVSREGTLRILFAFDPRRIAVLLVGGDKSGNWNAWYRKAIPEAGRLYNEHLAELKNKGKK